MSQFFEEFNDDVEASVLKTKKCQLPGFCLHQLVPRFCFGTTLFFLEQNIKHEKTYS